MNASPVIQQACPQCGAPVGLDAPLGLCLKCLAQAAAKTGLADETLLANTTNPPKRSTEEIRPSSELTQKGFGDYELLEEIARGGMGIVYRARQVSLDRIVAVKMILAGAAASKEFIHRFRTEAAAAANLQHPNIVAVHEVGTHQGENYLVMDFVDGPNLSHFVGQQPLPAQRAARHVKFIAEAIHYAHERGILHRDLKPSNVLIDSATDQPRVTDFGLAKRFHDKSEVDLTLTGQVLGSPNFMAPEQAAGTKGKVSRRTDVYGLGAILYHLLTARPPFQAESLPETLKQVAEAEPLSPRLLNPGVPRDLETICLKCLEKESSRRYQTARELADELDCFLEDKPIRAHPVTCVERTWRWCRRNPVIASLSAVTALLLLAVAIGSPIAAVRIDLERQRAERESSAARLIKEELASQLYAADVNLANEALRDFNRSMALQLLDRHDPHRASPDRPKAELQTDLRGFEWRYVYGQCRGGELTPLIRATNPFTAVRFVPHRDWLVATDGDGNVRLWDHRLRREIATLPAHTNSPRTGQFYARRALDVSRDGKTLAVGVGRTIALWDLATYHQVGVLRGDTSTISYVAFSSNGETLASGSQDGVVRLWHPVTSSHAPIAEWKVEGSMTSLAFSSDGTLLALGDSASRVRLWDVATSAAPHELPPLTGITSAAYPVFAPKGRRLAAAVGSEIKVWEFGTQHEVTSVPELQDRRGSLGVINTVAFSSEGRMLVSAGTDRNLTLWDLSGENREPVKLMGHNGEVYSAEFSPDGRLVASASSDGTVRLWDVSSPWSVPGGMMHGDWVYAIAFSPDAKLLASVGQNQKLKLWDVATEQFVNELNTPAYALAFSPNGSLLAMHAADKVRLLSVPSLAEVTSFPGSHPTFSPTGVDLIYFHRGRVHRRNLKTAAEQVWETGWSGVEARALSPDGLHLAAGGKKNHGVRVWKLDAPDHFQALGKHANIVYSLAFSPDGRWLVSASWDGTNYLWNLAREKNASSNRGETSPRFVALSAHNGEAWSAVFSPDGRTLATCGDDQTIRLWHLESLRQAATLRGHTQPVTVLAFALDGNLLASGSGDGTVRIWRAPTLEDIAKERTAKESE